MDQHGEDTHGVGSVGFIASRLIQTENIDTADARDKTANAIAATLSGIFHREAGKGTWEADPNGETSVLPAWRKTVFHYISGIVKGDTQDPKVWKERALCGSQRMNKLREITPNSGAYLNEADYYEPNWTKAFYGDNYERLLEIKKKYDPDYMFQVWNGVGGLRDELDDPMANIEYKDLHCPNNEP